MKLLLPPLLLVFAAATHAHTIWKVNGASVYSDTPPQLRLQNVQKFYPRTGKVSNAKKTPAAPNHANVIANTSVVHVPQKHLDEAVSPQEKKRRDLCQNAQDALARAAETGNHNHLSVYEANVVHHCISS